MTFLLYHLFSCQILPTGQHEMQTKMQQEEEITCTLSVLLAVLVNVNPSLVLNFSIGSCFQFPVFSRSPTSSLLGPSIDSNSIKSCSFLRLESQTLGAPISSSRNSIILFRDLDYGSAGSLGLNQGPPHTSSLFPYCSGRSCFLQLLSVCYLSVSFLSFHSLQ